MKGLATYRGGGTPKTGPARGYEPAELALFAQYREHRQSYQPPECVGGAACWVELGPPGISHGGECLVCGGRPRASRFEIALDRDRRRPSP